METFRDSNNLPEKACKYACGKLIKWDKSQNAYIEVDANQRHKCPNLNPNQKQLSNTLNLKITPEQQLYADTLIPTILEMRSSIRNIERSLMQMERGAY